MAGDSAEELALALLVGGPLLRIDRAAPVLLEETIALVEESPELMEGRLGRVHEESIRRWRASARRARSSGQ